MKHAVALMLGAALSCPLAAQELIPTASLALRFGGAQPVEDLRLRLSGSYRVELDELQPLLPVAGVELGPRLAPRGLLLGRPMAAPALSASADASAEEGSSNTWLWIGGGVVATAALASLASGSGDEEINNGTTSGNQTNCGLAGNIGGPGGPDVDPNCLP